MGSTPGMPVIDAVRRAIGQVGPGVVGVGCSGGADSIALLDATIAVAGAANVVAIAIDHRLVPTSAAACASVATFARARGAAAVIREVTVAKRASIEAAARDARYAAFEAVIEELGLVALFVGHTARDQAETILMRIIRGTGPAGLAGIPATRGRIVRPLLGLDRAAIEAYVAARTLPVIDDPMNVDPKLARVRVRATILPMLRADNPQIDRALLRLASSTVEWIEVIDALAAPFAVFPIDCAALAAQPAAIRKRAIAIALDRRAIDFAAAHLDAIDDLVTAPAHGQRSLDLPDAQVTLTYARLDVRRNEPPQRLADGSARDHTSTIGRSPTELPDGFVARTWRPGDRMRPLRLHGKSRKLSDLFIDAKVPRNLRVSAVVICSETTGEIAWAEHIGHAFDAPTSLKGWEK